MSEPPRAKRRARRSGPELVKRLARLDYRVQETQAEALGLTQSTVSRFSRGVVTPSGSAWRVVELLERVAELEQRVAELEQLLELLELEADAAFGFAALAAAGTILPAPDAEALTHQKEETGHGKRETDRGGNAPRE